MSVIERITLRRLNLPLRRPYHLSYRSFTVFEPFLVELWTDDGRYGFADGHIAPGSSAETREGGWQFLAEQLSGLPGQSLEAGRRRITARQAESRVAAGIALSAIDVAEEAAVLSVDTDVVLPLLCPFHATETAAIADEVGRNLELGFRCFKIKVGGDVEADLRRVAAIQEACAGRVSLRIDANRGYDRRDGKRFAAALDPRDIESFEQPCAAEDWAANAAVARVSTVPLMLDEPICSLADIERAAALPGIGFCKLKLKRFGGAAALAEALTLVRAVGLEPVLGDGLGSDITSWLEACVAARTIRNAGEFNGFLKPWDRLMDQRLPVHRGALHLPAGFRPRPDMRSVGRLTTASEEFRRPQWPAWPTAADHILH